MAYLEIFIDEFAYFSLFPYIIYDHLKCVSRLRATLYSRAPDYGHSGVRNMLSKQ
jgi:hypothetical protein